VLDGEIEVNGEKLAKRDGLGIEQLDNLQIKGSSDSEILVMEVPMMAQS